MILRRIQRKLYDLFKRRVLRREPHPVIPAVHAEGLSYLEASALDDLHRAVKQMDAQGIEGVLIEAGCAMGGSAIVMAAAKKASRPFLVYDVFGMPPAPTAGDGSETHARYEVIRSGKSQGIGGRRYYGYIDDLHGEVQKSFGRLGMPVDAINVRLVRGLLQETMRGDEPVALAHLDCDRHDAVRTALDRIVPRLVRGGRLIVDDSSGSRKAVEDYFAGKRKDFRFLERARLNIVRL